MDNNKPKGVWSLVVIVAALGYFVDLYDLVIFGIVRDSSLKALGLGGQALKDAGAMLFNCQMGGFLVGGVVWGVLSDRKGRLSVLFATIIMYSAANIANGFVHDLTTYAVLRFIAGVGLAGELGVGITLVAESLPKEKRTYGAMVVVVIGTLGAVAAGKMGQLDWRTAYLAGGGLGLGLLLLRVGTHESGIYRNAAAGKARKGAFVALFTSRERVVKYMSCICIGLPAWFTMGVLIFSAKDFAALIGVKGDVVVGKCIMYAYFGLAPGDFFCGLFSQWLKSRRKAILLFMGTSVTAFTWYFAVRDISLDYFYFLCFILGAFTGYWTIFVTIAAEQFGTNLRATVATTVPNFVRGSAVPITLCYMALGKHYGSLHSALMIGGVCMALAIVGIFSLKDSYGKDLDYVEVV